MRNDVTANCEPVVRRRLATYAVVLRDQQVLLAQLSQRTGWPGLWTLPGGGVDHGEDPRYALLREVMEETGQLATLGRVLDVNAEHSIGANPQGVVEDYQAVRLFFEATVPVDAPPPRVLEIGGSTAAAAWHPVDDVVEGRVPVVSVVRIGLAALDAAEVPARTPAVRTHQRLAAYAVVLRSDAVLLTRISSSGHHIGSWTLPGGGVEHGEDPRAAAVREVAEETGLEVVAGRLLDVHAVHFTGRAPDGELEDFHGVHLIFQGTVIGTRSIQVAGDGGTTDAADWVPIASVRSGSVPVLDVVRAALDAADVD